MISKKPLVSIIIPNYNGEKYLQVCLRSVLQSEYKNFELILIDDGSTDSSEAIINRFKKIDTRILFHKNKKNLGAAASRNSAAKQANGEILFFLDNDTEVSPAWLTEIIKTLAKADSIGACQSLLIDFEKRNIIQVAGTKLWAATGWGLPIAAGEKNNEQVKEIDIVALSAALAVKKNIFLEIGGFDEDEAVVTEDLDLSWRIWLTGNRIILSPKSQVYHWTKSLSMRSNMQHNKQKIYYHLTKNAMISILKNYETGNALKYFFTCLVISYGRAFLALVRRKELSVIIGTLQGTGYILFHIVRILEKRRKIQTIRRFTDHELFDKVIVQESLMSIYKKYFIQTNLI